MNLILNIKKHWLIILIILTGLAFRFLPLCDYEFSHDELSGLSRTTYSNFFDELYYGIKIDAHPALIQLFLWVWVTWFGYNEIAIKLPFLLCGIFSVWYIYRFSVLFFNKNVGYISATIISLSFIFIVYSSYARMYIPGVLFSILLLISLFKIIFSQDIKTKDYFSFALFAALCAYNHHMSSLFAFVCAGLSFLYIEKERLKKYSLFCGLAVLLYLPHLSITLYQLSIGGIGAQVGGWLPPPRLNEIYYFIKTLFGCGYSGLIIMSVFGLVSIFRVIKNKRISKKQSLLFWIFTINYVIIHLYSVYKNPILQNSCLLFSGVAFIVFLASFFENETYQRISLITFCLIGLLSFETIYSKHFFTKVNIHQFNQQVKTYLDIEKKFGPKKVTGIFSSEEVFVSIYEKKYHKELTYITNYSSEFNSILALREYLKKLKEPFVVLGDISPDKIEVIKEFYPYVYSQREDYFNFTLVLSKLNVEKSSTSILNKKPISNNTFKIYSTNQNGVRKNNDNVKIKFSENSPEFPLNIELPFHNTKLNHYEFLLAELIFEADSINQLTNDKFCLTIGEKGKESMYYSDKLLSDFFQESKKQHTLTLVLFCGGDYMKWNKQEIEINMFIWKVKHSHYALKNFKLYTVNYSPTRWTLWD